MHIEVHTDHHIKGGAELTESVRSTVEAALGRYGERITRVDVHLSDENGAKKAGDDIKCAMEARMGGLKPSGVTHHATQLEDAVSGAVDKLTHVIDHTLGKLNA
jgi:hypothetical protein